MGLSPPTWTVDMDDGEYLLVDEYGTVYADNWLSRLLYKASKRVTPMWCQSENHWTARITSALFTDCPCCLLFRGLAVGFALGITPVAVWVILAALTT